MQIFPDWVSENNGFFDIVTVTDVLPQFDEAVIVANQGPFPV